MKRTNLRRLLPILLTLVIAIVCIFGITAAASTTSTIYSYEIKYASVVLNNDVDLIFWADLDEETAQNNDTFMTFNDGAPVYYSTTESVNGTTYIVYRYNDILPQDIGKPVTAKLYIDGELSSFSIYNVKDYCQYVLTYSSSDSLKTLVSDLLVYGESIQALLGEDPANYVTKGITGLVPSAPGSDMTVLYGNEVKDNLKKGEEVTLSSSKIQMTSGMELLVDFDFLDENVDVSEYSACLAINGREQEVKISASGHVYRAVFDAFYPYELFENVKVEVYKGNARVSKSFTLSLASYLDALSDNETYADAVNAYYNYGYSAHLYGGTHTISMPGSVEGNGMGTSTYDDYGTVTYSCSLCGEVIDTIDVTHIRDFEGANSDGSPANSATNGSLFTLTTESETLQDGSSNSYLSIVRDTENNLGSGGFGYYFTYAQARRTATDGKIDNLEQYSSKKYTFDFSVKAPEAGLADFNIYLQNSLTSGTGRYLRLINITPDGAIENDVSAISASGTVTKDKWTDVTVTMEFYESNGEQYIFLEYYINNVFADSVSVSNTLYNNSFNRIHISSSTDGLTDGQGILFDNFVFAHGCVHEFTENILQHVKNEGQNDVRDVVDKINNEFELADFSTVVRWNSAKQNGEYLYKETYTETQWLRECPTDIYEQPESTPKNYQHPRLLFNSSDIPAIVENMAKPENEAAYARFMTLVNSSDDGKLTPIELVTPAAFEYTNYSTSTLRTIEAKALYYALFKNDPERTDAVLRGYEAIYAMKNYMLTFSVEWDFSDQCRMYGEGMYYAALVYDWCYDLLTEDDKDQFRLGVQNLFCDGTSNQPWLGETHNGRKLEGGFPALYIESQTPLTGHGAEAQVLRDYFAFAIAIYDEDPTWYQYVGGMIYQNYVDARNYFYSASYYPDGSAGYNIYRYICDLYNAWLFEGMGVELPYNEEDMQTVIHGLMSLEINNNFIFATADGSGTSSYGQYRVGTTMGDAALISSYLFDDPTALAIAERLCGYEYNRNGFSHQLGISCAYYLILTANDLTASEDYRDQISNVEYHGGFQQQVVSRNDKSEDSVVVLMQGAQHYPGGHTHQNAGSFQIWYKGMLTRDDGLYDAYGSDHHFYYHMSATAHNTLLIYNQNLAGEKMGPGSGTTKYYNGGQKYELSIPVSYDSWVNDEKFSYGELIGFDYDDEDNPSYVYFANDITKAYDERTVDYVERSMMTLYTGDEETPMVMFVFDNITSDEATFKKTFLLQCAEAPLVDGNTVTVDNGEGKLVLTSLLGNDEIKAYGRTSVDGVVGDGDGSERFYLSNAGENLLPGGATMIGDKNSDLSVVWGHVEISPESTQKTNQLMNVLYVSDSGTVVSATPTLLESDYMTGATFKNHTVMFVNNADYSSDTQTFVTTGEGTMKYYIGGLYEGTWKVTVNGEEIGEYDATSDGRMIAFEAPTGTVVVEPSGSDRPEGTAIIRFILNGGELPEGTHNYYFKGKNNPLPAPTKYGATFSGWYTDANFENQITEIPDTATRPYTLYAKWSEPIIFADYSQGGSISDYPALNYTGNFKIVKAEVPYLLWTDTNSGGGSIMGKDGAYATYARESLKVTFSMSLGRNGDENLAPIQLYLRDTNGSATRYINVFRTDSSGSIYLGNSSMFAQMPAEGMIEFSIVLDFENGMAYTYDTEGVCTKSSTLSGIGIVCPEEYSSYEEWFTSLSASGGSLATFKATSAGSIRVGYVKIVSGDISESCMNFGPNSTTHKWNDGEIISAPSTTDCTPGIIRYTCTECGITKESSISSDAPHASLELIAENGVAKYRCTACNCVYTPDTGYFMDGTDHNAMIGVGNSAHYNTATGSQNPLINEAGEYELLKKNARQNAKLELWIPNTVSSMSTFTSATNATGFISFKANAYTDDYIYMQFVDTSANAGSDRWTANGCIMDPFFNISKPDASGVVNVTGWNDLVLKSVTVGDDKFTGWMDIKIAIELSSADDTITLHYYVDGVYLGAVSKELTTSTNAINSVYILGYCKAKDSGLKLDDISFCCSNSGWTLGE